MTINRLIAIPALAAGILGGALGVASTAAAAPSTGSHATAGHAATADHSTYAPSVRDENKNATARHFRQDAH
jgi:hypothetical protein